MLILLSAKEVAQLAIPVQVAYKAYVFMLLKRIFSGLWFVIYWCIIFFIYSFIYSHCYFLPLNFLAFLLLTKIPHRFQESSVS